MFRPHIIGGIQQGAILPTYKAVKKLTLEATVEIIHSNTTTYKYQARAQKLWASKFHDAKAYHSEARYLQEKLEILASNYILDNFQNLVEFHMKSICCAEHDIFKQSEITCRRTRPIKQKGMSLSMA
jgi:hypothetical protein